MPQIDQPLLAFIDPSLIQFLPSEQLIYISMWNCCHRCMVGKNQQLSQSKGRTESLFSKHLAVLPAAPCLRSQPLDPWRQ